MRKNYIIVSGLLTQSEQDKLRSDSVSKNLLEDKVNEKIAEGYYPVGNILTTNGTIAHQAMVLSETAAGKASLDEAEAEEK